MADSTAARYCVRGSSPAWGPKEDTASNLTIAYAIASALFELLRNEPDAMVTIIDNRNGIHIASWRRTASGQWQPV